MSRSPRGSARTASSFRVGRAAELFGSVAGEQECVARLVEPVVGAGDALEEARAALGRPHLHDEVDIAPVDAEIEAGGTDEAAKPPLRHRLLDLAPRLDVERAVMDADGQVIVVHRPEILENEDRKSTRLNSSH